MPNIQIRGGQIKAAAVEASNINLSGSFDFRAASGLQFLTKPEADKTTFPATTQFVHTIVSGSTQDGVQGGNGIAIDTGTSPDTIAVDLGTNPGLQFASNKLVLKAKSEIGGTITLDGDGIYIADSAIGSAKLAGSIANAKLANSTISGKALGTNLDNLSAGNGLALGSAYNGSAAQTMDLNLDGSTLAKGGSGVKVADGGIGSTQIANDAITAAKIADDAVGSAAIADDAITSALIADDAVTSAAIADDAVGSAQIADNAVDNARIANGAVSIAKLAFQARQDVFTANGSTLAFALANQVAPEFEKFVMVFVNGLMQSLVASSPSGQSEYTVSTAGSTTTVTFGANLTNGDALEIRSLA